MIDGSAIASGEGAALAGRIQQFGRIGDKSCGSSPAGDFQNALVVRLHDIFVADPENRIIFHVAIPKLPEPDGIRDLSRIVP